MASSEENPQFLAAGNDPSPPATATARVLGQHEDLPLRCSRVGLALSWDATTGKKLDLDIQAIAFDRAGNLIQAVYYNNLKAFGRGLTHSSDEVTGEKHGLDEVVWADFGRIPDNVGLILYVVACFSGGHFRDARNGRFHVLEEGMGGEVAQFALEQSDEEVDLVAALVRGGGGGWALRLVSEPAQDGRHFVDILEPTIGNYVRKLIPGAPKRIKAAFAMEKGAVADLPKTDVVQSVRACLGWETSKGTVDLDVSAILLGPGGQHVDTVFFGNLEAQGVKHSGDNLTGEGDGDDEQIMVNLNLVGPRVQQICFVVNIYTPKRTFAQVANPFCRVVDEACGSELCRYSLREAGREQGLIIARLAREPGGRWGFHALGLPCHGRTYKDALPQIRACSSVNTTSLYVRQDSFTGSELRSSGHQAAHSPRLSARSSAGSDDLEFPSPFEVAGDMGAVKGGQCGCSVM
mmetsp:Transcript_24504/g.64668  ORF Transcript_24504/g.64668 Transcript_24504/m.64668 type:complete len:463 (-) Transcript_24504:394-1782(-)